jgi:Undecaprenyl-phosphate glucose phosphotransferase
MASDIAYTRSPSSSGLHTTTFRLDGPDQKTATVENLSTLVAKLAATEFAAVAATAYATSLAYFIVVLGGWPPNEAYISSALLIAGLVLLVSLSFRHYVSIQTHPLHRFLWSGIGAVALAFSFFLSILFLLKGTDDYSRVTFFVQLAAAATAVLTVRTFGYAAICSAISAGRVEARRAVLIGNRVYFADIEDRLSEAGVQTVRSLPFPGKPQFSANAVVTDFDGDVVRQMIDTCRQLRLDDIVILATATDLARSARLADALSELPVFLHVIPVEAGEFLGSARLGELGSLMTIQLLHPPLSAFDRIVKRAFDITAASLGLLLLSPFLAVVSIAIKLDSRGPVLFRQTRHGYNNETIRVFKFRSMCVMEDGHSCKQATRNDTRITRMGHRMRCTNIDELPQLLNVLLGEMSIVGPRPHPIALNKVFQQQISPLSRRHNVRPGITGWAQVNGHRGETDTLEKMQRRIECDLYYIDNWSFLLDLKIILMTLFSKRAYMNAQ